MATLGPPRGRLKGPLRKSHENVGSFTALWAPLGVPLGIIFDIFCVFSLLFLYVFCEFLCHVGTLLVSVGVYRRPWGSTGHPLRRYVEKVTKMLVR